MWHLTQPQGNVRNIYKYFKYKWKPFQCLQWMVKRKNNVRDVSQSNKKLVHDYMCLWHTINRM